MRQTGRQPVAVRGWPVASLLALALGGSTARAAGCTGWLLPGVGDWEFWILLSKTFRFNQGLVFLFALTTVRF